MTGSSLDPDRFFDRQTPGAHEWWYFDAISADGRDVLVIVWYAGLPFDPSYGVATLRHLKNPGKYPAPRALDHSAIGFSWYRDGKTLAYALNGHRADAFKHEASPFAVEVASNRVERDGFGYKLSVATPAVDRRPIRAEIRFSPADATEPFERDLGRAGAPHHWMLAAADCRVVGRISVDGESMAFAGRGYHDHNAGAEEMSLAMRRWEWGRFHHGPSAEVYYESIPRVGESRALWITTRDGRPEMVREGEDIILGSGEDRGRSEEARNVFGLRTPRTRGYGSNAVSLRRKVAECLDDGPFYRRWLADFEVDGQEMGSSDSRSDDPSRAGLALPRQLDRQGKPCPTEREMVSSDRPPLKGRGIAELLDTRHLHRPWFNWMIPYRLKWPGRS